jgi:hypothetical protein
MALRKLSQSTLFGLIIFALAITGVALSPESSAGQEQQPPAGAIAVQEFEGTVIIGLGKYFYLPAAKGFDVVVQGQIEGQDAGYLTGKEVRVRGTLLKDDPSVFIADSIELKEAAGYRTIFTRTEEPKLDDHLGTLARASYPALTITRADKSEDWEGKTKGKIFGKLAGNSILVADEKGKEIGKILVDRTSDFANYYIKKLRLFDKFWFYLNLKETVDAKVRRRTRELFHADVVFAGLY